MANLSPKFPLFFSQEGGYESNKQIKEVVKQNLKNLMLTSPGERIMIPDFGVGLRNYLFEQNTEETANNIKVRADAQIKRYMPFVEIQEFVPSYNENELYVTIKYFILPISETDILNINI